MTTIIKEDRKAGTNDNVADRHTPPSPSERNYCHMGMGWWNPGTPRNSARRRDSSHPTALTFRPLRS